MNIGLMAVLITEHLVIKQADGGDKPIQTVYIQDTPPANINALWVDTSGLGTALEEDEKLASIIQAIQVIQNYLDTIVHQRDFNYKSWSC